jgi:hypothetical protein
MVFGKINEIDSFEYFKINIPEDLIQEVWLYSLFEFIKQYSKKTNINKNNIKRQYDYYIIKYKNDQNFRDECCFRFKKVTHKKRARKLLLRNFSFDKNWLDSFEKLLKSTGRYMDIKLPLIVIRRIKKNDYKATQKEKIYIIEVYNSKRL